MQWHFYGSSKCQPNHHLKIAIIVSNDFEVELTKWWEIIDSQRVWRICKIKWIKHQKFPGSDCGWGKYWISANPSVVEYSNCNASITKEAKPDIQGL